MERSSQATVEQDNEADTTENEKTGVYLPFRDQIAQEALLSLIIAVGFFYGYVYGEWVIFLYALIGPVFLWAYTRTEFYDPLIIDRSFDSPLVETCIVLLVFLNVIVFITPILVPLGVVVYFIAPMIIIGGLCIGFLLLYRGYPRSSIGITTEGLKYGRTFLTAFTLAGIGTVILRIIIQYPQAITSSYYELFQTLIWAIFVLSIPVAVVEELVFRGIMQPRITCKCNSRLLGITITSIVFAIFHAFSISSSLGASSQDITYVVLTALLTRLPLGIIMGVIWDMTRSLFAPSVIHFTNNTFYYLILAVAYLGV